MTPMRSTLLALVLGLAAGFVLGFGLDGRAVSAVPVNESAVSHEVARRTPAASGSEDAGLVDVEALPPSMAAAGATDEDLDRRARAAASGVEQRVAVPLPDDAASATETISGQVVDGEGRPIAGVTVVSNGATASSLTVIEGDDTQKLGREWDGPPSMDESLERHARRLITQRGKTRTAVSDAGGQIVLSGLESGSHRLMGYLEGYAFDAVTVAAGASAQIVGRPIGVFRLDVRMPDGSPAESAVVTAAAGTVPRRVSALRRPLRWSLDAPEVRAAARSMTFTVLAGSVRRLEGFTYTSELASTAMTIDLDRDGAGPHVVQLEPRSTLRVTLEVSGSDDGPGSEAWVKVIPATDATGQSLAAMLAGVRGMTAGADGVFEQPLAGPGRYLLAAGRLGSEPEVTETITVGAGPTEHRLVLSEIDSARYLVARCIGPDGAPLTRVRFRGEIDNGTFPMPSFINAVDRGAEGYWLPIDDISGDETWSESSKVTLAATARELGELKLPLVLGQRDVEFVFQPSCSIAVQVEGSELAGLTVSAVPVTGDEDDQPLRRRLSLGGRPVSLDAGGHALLEGLQPGRFRVSLLGSGRLARMAPPLATVDVTLVSGTLDVVLSAPVLFEVAVHAANLDVGTLLYLVKAGVAGTKAGLLNGLNSKVDGERTALFVSVPAGDYVLSVLGAGNQQMRVTVPCGRIDFVSEPINAYAISEVKPGKLGQRAGLKQGDIVVQLNGEAVNGNNFHQKLAVAIESAAVQLTIERGTATLSVSLGPIEAGSLAMEQIGVSWAPRTR